MSLFPTAVSIIIPSFRRPDLLGACLQSLANQSLAMAAFEIIVVEDDALPGNPEVSLPANARRILLKGRYGFTGTVNRGIALCSGTFVLLLNNDVTLAPDTLERLVAELDHDPNCGFATCKLLNARHPSLLDGAGDAVLLGGGAFRLGHEDCDCGQFDHPVAVAAACGAATLFRRSLLIAVGGLDEDFFAYLDDVDLGLRSHLLGYHGRYVHDAVAYHLGSATLGARHHPLIIELITRNQLSMIVKDYPTAIAWRCMPQIVLYQLLWCGFCIRRRFLGPLIRGYLGCFRNRKSLLRKRILIQQTRLMANDDFLALLRASEAQIFNWQKLKRQSKCPVILRIYFGIFRWDR